MGNWHGTCGISSLPIRRGERVVLFPIIKNKYADYKGGGYSYQYNQFKPLCLPLFGDYDDSGSITNIEEDKYFIDYFNEMLSQGMIKTEESLPQELEELVEFIERGKIEDVGFMLVHEPLYYTVLSEISVMRDFFPGELKKRYLDSCKEFLDEKKASECIFFMYDRYPFSRFFYENNMMYFLEKVEEEYTGDVKYNEDYTEGNNNLFTSMINILLFDRFLELSRKSWILQAGAGSPCQYYHLHKLVADFTIYKEQEWKDIMREDSRMEYDHYNNCTKSY